jgi:hypothetical protein
VCKPSQVSAAANAIIAGADMETKEMSTKQDNGLPEEKQHRLVSKPGGYQR